MCAAAPRLSVAFSRPHAGSGRGSTFWIEIPLTDMASGSRPSTTVAMLMRRSDLFPGCWERMDERRIDRGDTGGVGRIAAGGKGADAPVVHAGAGGGISGSVS